YLRVGCARNPGALHRARLRHRRLAFRVRQELPGAELSGVFPTRLPTRGAAAYRIGLGARRHARRRIRRRDSRVLRALLRPPAIRDLVGTGLAASVPDITPLSHGSAATTG